MSDLGDLVFLDTETTGLKLHHDIWEVAYAVGDGPIKQAFLSHSLQNADPKALEINGYYTRFRPEDVARFAELELRELLEGKTLVGANISFDAIRLQLRWFSQPWHYRMIDVESMAVQAFHLPKPEGLASTVARLRTIGYDIPENNHTAAQDVETVRAVYKTLMEEQF